MTVIRPNSISGINSITGNGGDINLFRADGSKADVPIVNNITAGVVTATKFVGPIEGNVTGNLSGGTINATSGTITGNLGVGGVLTYEDVTNIDSVGVITARAGINVSGGTITGDGSGLTGVGLGTDGSANTSGIITATAFVPTGGQLFNRNKIINGEFRINQRNHSGSAGHNTYTLDRWKYARSANTEFSTSQSTDTPDGFATSVKMDCIGANGSTGGGDYAYWRYHIEGQDLQDLCKGTSAAKPATLSFYFKSDITGNFAINVIDGNNRMCNMTYTVSDTNWNRYIVTIPADTTGAIANTVATGLSVHFYIIAGSSITSGGSLNSWGAYNSGYLAQGHTANIVSTDHNLYLTGVQLEVGSVATPFEHRTIADELARCQRYCVQYNSNNASRDFIMPAKVLDGDDADTAWQPPVAPRTTVPTISVSNASHICLSAANNDRYSPVNFNIRDNTAANPYSSIVFLNFDLNSSPLTSGDMVFLAFENNTSGGYLRYEWEL